jgi:hypothetical protein
VKKNYLLAWAPAFVLLLLAILSFGLLIPWLGFYWDDWAKILVDRLYGLGGYWAYYAGDRPLSAWTHILLTPILGTSPLPWQGFTLLLRWASAAGMFWALASLWPRQRRAAFMASALFLVYPIFTLQPIAVTFHQQWLQFALFFLSLGAMVAAFRKPEHFWPFTILALASSLIQLTITEYFSALELVRPLILWVLAGEVRPSLPARLRLTLKRYWPYGLVIAGYVVWRLFLLKLPDQDPYRAVTLYNLLSQPLPTLQSLLPSVSMDTYTTLLGTWLNLLGFNLSKSLPPFYLYSLAIGVVGGLGTALYLVYRHKDGASDDNPDGVFLRQLLLIGLAGLVLGMAPAWITGRFLTSDPHTSRYAQPAMFGASLIWVCGIEWLLRRRLQKIGMFGVMVALAIVLQLRVANDFRWIWNDQLQFYWQLTWRAPALAPGTAIFSENELFPNQGLFSTSAALNLLYPQPASAKELAYWAYTLNPRFLYSSLVNSDIRFGTTFRSLSFQGNPRDLILVANDAKGSNCLWVLDDFYKNNPYLDSLILDNLPASNTSRILPDPATRVAPPEELFGKEPVHGWCYYFEKAELARQTGDWQSVASLGDQARQAGFAPDKSQSDSPQEWMTFIAGYAHAAQWQTAANLTLASHQRDSHYDQDLCQLWQGFGRLGVPPAQMQQVKTALKCGP